MGPFFDAEVIAKDLEELKSIELNFEGNENIGKIEIALSKRKIKRYGCCKQEKPDKNFKVIQKRKNRRIVKYEKFQEHYIEISKWVMELDVKIRLFMN